MKMIIVAFALVAAVVAIPVEQEPIKILRSDLVQEPQGPYKWSFETENGIRRDESGALKEVLDEEKKPHVVVVVKGSYAYTNEDGKLDEITYFADETGYHAEGASIPKPVEPVSRR